MNMKNSVPRIWGMFLALLIWTCFIGDVAAQMMDDIVINQAKDGKVSAIILLSGQVHYLRHFSDKKGQHLEIYFQILDKAGAKDWLDNEIRKSPPSGLIPGFVTTVRNLATEPKLVIEFDRPAEYGVRIGKSQRSFVITFKPEKQDNSAKTKAAKDQAGTVSGDANAPKVEIQIFNKAAAELPAAVKLTAPESVAPAIGNASPQVESGLPQIEAASGVVPSTPVAAAEPTLEDRTRETDSQAEVLMGKGREALKVNEAGVAIEAFNKVLLLPPNKYSQDAQEWIGIARESAGQKFKAKLEYETYLKTYTTGEGVDRVKERLAKLAVVQQPTQAAAKEEKSKERKEFQTVSNGSLSMNYYHGESLTTLAGASNNPSSSNTDQNMLITSVNASVRSRNDRYDSRFVFQDTYSKNYLIKESSQVKPNRLSTLYYDIKDSVTALSARVGRQSPSGGGVMGRFDGVAAGYGITPQWQATASTGQLSDYTTASKPKFYSLGLALVNSTRWGGSVYYVNQRTDAFVDRSAVGADIRYFDANKNAYALLDYDTFFRVINTALLQGTVTADAGTSFTFALDHRKSPAISLSNAAIGSPNPINTLLDLYGKEAVKALALERTGSSDSVSFGVNQQIREKWQAGADINVSRTSSLPESPFGCMQNLTNIPAVDLVNYPAGCVPATPSTGSSKGINARLIGNGIFTINDVSVFSLGYSSSKLSKAENVMLSNHLGWAEKWTADTSLRVSWQSSYDLGGSATGKITMFSPMIRLEYRARNDLSFGVDGGIDITNNTPATGQASKTTRKYFSLGGRKDF
ncbi:MAG: hypothetical protein HY306_05755 [Nitrosomonadales bacterium]|nr:hypothetical protein [Nitrosomonadales bacterium]